MARIDSILGIVVEQRATELRLGVDKLPKMLRRGEPLKLAIPVTHEETLRHLLGEILSPEREEKLRQSGKVDLDHEAASLGAFHVTITLRGTAEAREPGFDVVFVRIGAADGAREARPFAATAPAAPVAPHAATTITPVPAPLPTPPPASASEAPPDGALARLLARAASVRASDVHLMAGHAPSVRVDGRLRALEDEPPADVERLLGALLSAEARARVAAGGSADLALEIAGLGRFRVNVYQAAGTACAAIRLLAGGTPSLASLDLPIPIDDLVTLPSGLVIVCGPTGSGKSTTLAALAQEALRRRSAMLVSLEDPIEYVIHPAATGSLVRQRQVGRDVKDFATGLRDALREDPDVILIGEMRDPESITLALTAAETGHLVLTSLHSRGTASAIERIVDVYPSERQPYIRSQLADALRAVVAERLLPRASGSGRIAALELLRVNHNVAGLIRDGRTAQIPSALQSGRKEGLLPLERCLADLVRAGKITLDHARAVANDTGSLASYVKGI